MALIGPEDPETESSTKSRPGVRSGPGIGMSVAVSALESAKKTVPSDNVKLVRFRVAFNSALENEMFPGTAKRKVQARRNQDQIPQHEDLRTVWTEQLTWRSERMSGSMTGNFWGRKNNLRKIAESEIINPWGNRPRQDSVHRTRNTPMRTKSPRAVPVANKAMMQKTREHPALGESMRVSTFEFLST